MNALTPYEVSMRDKIARAIDAGRCDEARELVNKFMAVKDRTTKCKRAALIRSIRWLVSVMNGEEIKPLTSKES